MVRLPCPDHLPVRTSRRHAIAAMLAHPLGPDADQAEELLDRILAKDGLQLS